MSYAHGTTVYRDRRVTVANPYNPDRQTVAGWAEYDVEAGIEAGNTVALEGVYIAASSTAAVPDAMRTQSTDYQSLYSTERDIDVAIGDRIRVGADQDGLGGLAYYINQRPQGDINPFTGWAPGVEIPLVGVVG